MREEIKVSKKKDQEKLVKRYNLPDMLMHWAVAAGFILALITGYVVFFEGTSKFLVNELGYVIRLLHRIGGVILIAAPLLYFIFSKKRFGFVEAFKWDKSDFGWLKAAPKHYYGFESNMPPQKKYNTGQKLFYLGAIVFGTLLAISGIILWFGLGSDTFGLIMLFIHDVSAVAITPLFLVHVYLVVWHPVERTSFNAMTTGYMDREYAKKNHTIWYNQVVEEEKQQEVKTEKPKVS